MKLAKILGGFASSGLLAGLAVSLASPKLQAVLIEQCPYRIEFSS
jgi:hypothetical protein